MNNIKILSREVEPTYKDDCERIVLIFATKNIEISIYEADDLWSLYSEDRAAGWIMMDRMTNEEIYKNLKQYWTLI